MGCVSSVDNCFAISKNFTKDINLRKERTVFFFPQLKRHKNKFSSRIFHIITAYAKDTCKLKILLAKLKSLSFISWLVQVIFMANTFYSPNPYRNLTKNLIWHFIVMTYLFFLKQFQLNIYLFFSSQSIQHRRTPHFALISCTFTDTDGLFSLNI